MPASRVVKAVLGLGAAPDPQLELDLAADLEHSSIANNI
jgi:hypothetical protein